VFWIPYISLEYTRRHSAVPTHYVIVASSFIYLPYHRIYWGKKTAKPSPVHYFAALPSIIDYEYTHSTPGYSPTIY
jgi:hypothetical protein